MSTPSVTRRSARSHRSHAAAAAAENGDADHQDEEMDVDEDAPEGGESTPVASRSASSQSSSSHLRSEDTPTRLSRLHEKAELADLNKRLEFYILKQKQRDASADSLAREIEEIRSHAQAQMEMEREKFKSELHDLRKKREEGQVRLTRAEQDVAR
jgi:hypothetical protein